MPSWRRKWQSTPVLLPGKSHGQRSLVGNSQWGHKESDTTEWLHYSCHVPARLLQSCLTLCDSIHWCPPGSSLRGISPNNNTGVGCCAFLQGIFPIQGSNLCLLCLLHWQAGSLPLAPLVYSAIKKSAFESAVSMHTYSEVDEPRASYIQWIKSERAKYYILMHIHGI